MVMQGITVQIRQLLFNGLNSTNPDCLIVCAKDSWG